MENGFLNLFCFTAPLFGMKEDPSSNIHQDDEGNNQRGGVHLYYVLHFPFPNVNRDSHDNNQRLVLLFGFGKRRQEFLKRLKNLKDEMHQCFVGMEGREPAKMKSTNTDVVK